MSRRKKPQNSKSAPVERTLLADEVVPLRVYYVRMHEESHELTLMMNFGDGNPLPFDEVQRLYHTSSFSPFIYTIDLDVRMGKEKLYLQYKNGQKAIGEYRLEMICPGTIYGQQKVEEKRTEGYLLHDYFNVQRCFHFGVRFNSKWKSTVPGRILQRISNEN